MIPTLGVHHVPNAIRKGCMTVQTPMYFLFGYDDLFFFLGIIIYYPKRNYIGSPGKDKGDPTSGSLEAGPVGVSKLRTVSDMRLTAAMVKSSGTPGRRGSDRTLVEAIMLPERSPYMGVSNNHGP